MEDILQNLLAVACECNEQETALKAVLSAVWDPLNVQVREVGRAWSQSMLGYHAHTFIRGLEPARPDEVWDADWGRVGAFSSRTRGRWETWDPQALLEEILRRTGLSTRNIETVDEATRAARMSIIRLREDVRPIVDALVAAHAWDASLVQAQERIGALSGETNDMEAMRSRYPKSYATHDTLAGNQGPVLPIHLQLETRFAQRFGLAGEFITLARECRYIASYLRNKLRFADAFAKPAAALPTSVAKARECSVLLLAANPDSSDRLALLEEVRGIEEKIRASEHRALVRFKAHLAPRPGDLVQALNENRPIVVHFSGHGNAKAIVLHDDQGGEKLVKASALERLFESSSERVRVVVLASCYSAPQAKAIVQVVDCVVGMKRSVDDESARVFSAAFYGALGFGLSVATAFEQGRAEIALRGLPDERVPVLLVRDGVDPASLVLVAPPTARGGERLAAGLRA
jgi:hypothetical protein